MRRLLSTITNNNNNNNNNNNSDSNDEDDDFSHLDTRTHSHSHSHSHTGLSTQQLNNDIGGGGIGGIGGGTTGDDFLVNAKSPMFSPAAEAELFMLATNFLLCTFLL